MEPKWSKHAVKMEPTLSKNERKNLSKSSEARWNIWGKSKNKSNRSLRKIIETPREKLRKIPGRSIENLRKIVWKSMRNRYRGEVFIETGRGRGFRWNGTGTRFSLQRYGDEVFTQTVRGRCFHLNGTGAKRYGSAFVTQTIWRRSFRSHATGAMFSLTRYGGEVVTQTVRGRGLPWNGTGTRFSLKRSGAETFGYSWETPGECVGTFPWEFVRQKRSNYRPHRSTRM